MCLTFLLVGCNSNTAKESPTENTEITVSSSASETEIPTEDTDVVDILPTVVNKDIPKESETSTTKATLSTQTDKQAQVTTKQEAQSKQEVTSSSTKKEEKSKVDTTEKKEPDKPTKTEEPKQEIPKKEPPKEQPQTFDVTPYVNYANEYARSIGLATGTVATECWDNPISANAGKKNIKSDIASRLNRYKNDEGCEGVWIWTVKESDSDYLIYIGYY